MMSWSCCIGRKPRLRVQSFHANIRVSNIEYCQGIHDEFEKSHLLAKMCSHFRAKLDFLFSFKRIGGTLLQKRIYIFGLFFGFLLTVLSILNTGLHISHILLTEVVTAIWTFLRLDISLISTIRNVWAFNHFFQL